MERKLDGWEAAVLDAVKRDDRDEAIRQLDCHYLFAEAPDKLRVLNIKFDLVTSNEEKVKVLNQKFRLAASNEEKVEVLNQKFDLVASNEEKVKVLNQKFDLVSSDEEKVKVLNQKFDLVASNEEKVKVLNQKFDLVSSDEEKVKVLNQKFDLVSSDEEKVKVLNQKFDLVSSDEEKVSVLDWKLEVLRNMGEGEAALNTKIETIARLMPHMTPEVQNKLQEESTRATAALNGGQPTRGAAGAGGTQAVEMLSDSTMVELMEKMSRNVAVFQSVFEAGQEAAMYPNQSTKRDSASQDAFKESLIHRYQAARENATKLECVVTGQFLTRHVCTAGHLVPHAQRSCLPHYGLSPAEINDPRNGLLWAEGIEKKMHPPEEICFLYHYLNQAWHFVVLNPAIMKEVIAGTNKTFGDCHERALNIPPEKSPWKRVLWVHAKLALTHAMSKKWISGTLWEERLKKTKEFLLCLQDADNSDEAMAKWTKQYETSKEKAGSEGLVGAAHGTPTSRGASMGAPVGAARGRPASRETIRAAGMLAVSGGRGGRWGGAREYGSKQTPTNRDKQKH